LDSPENIIVEKNYVKLKTVKNAKIYVGHTQEIIVKRVWNWMFKGEDWRRVF